MRRKKETIQIMRAKIKDFSPKDKASLILRLTDIQFRKTTANDDYGSMLGFDGTELIDVKFWKLKEEDKELLSNGEIYFLTGTMKDYQGKMQFNVTEYRKITEEDEVDIEEFYERAKLDSSELEKLIYSYIDRIDNQIINKVIRRIISLYAEEFFNYPAAMTMHHNYYSGLAYHIYSMLQASDAYLKIYPFLNKSLVYGGIIIHDLGKIVELSGPKGTEYTKKGNLLGHIPIGYNMIHQIATSLEVQDSEEVLALEHILLSHHGLLEYGSPKEPLIPEAMLIYLLDYADSRLAALEKEVETTEKGTYTNQIMALDRKSFYIPDID